MPTGKLGWFPFYSRDWYGDPKLACCHPTTRGIWIDLLALMFTEGQASIEVDVVSLMRLGRCDVTATEQFLKDLGRYKFADVTECNHLYTITSRRFERDLKALETLKEKNREKVKRFRSKHPVTKRNQIDDGYVTKSSESEYESDSGSLLRNKNLDCRLSTLSPGMRQLAEGYLDAVQEKRNGQARSTQDTRQGKGQLVSPSDRPDGPKRVG